MAYSESAAARLRAALGTRPGLAEKAMFGGVFFLLDGKVALGLHGEELVVPAAVADVGALVRERGARRFDLRGRRPMPGWVLVAPEGYEGDADLRRWIEQGLAFASSRAKGRRSGGR